MIRRPRPTEIKLLPQIENQADLRFARVGLQRVIDMPPATHRLARPWRSSWPAVGGGLAASASPVGFALMKLHGGTAWLDQLSVLDRWQRHGYGAALIDRSARTAQAPGFDALYLSTYRDVPWNGPYYERRGFAEVPRGAFTRPLRVVLMTECSHGHPVWRRVIMRRRV